MVVVAITSLVDGGGGDGRPCHCGIGGQWRRQWQALSMAVAVDGSGGNGVVPVTLHNNDNMMALAAMASSTNGGGGNGGRCHRLSSSG